MELLPKHLEETLPALGGQEGMGEEAIAHVKFFTPWSHWTWYASEYDPKDRLFFGLVVGDYTEYGYFSLDELESVSGPEGLRIERDLYWDPRPIRECRPVEVSS